MVNLFKKLHSRKMRNSNSKNKFDFSKFSQFEKDVLIATYKIPKGKVSTYGRIAKMIGKPKSARAVGNVLNKNPFAPTIPCHRVIKSDGQIGGFASGTRKKIKILSKEGIRIESGRVKDPKEVML